MSECSVATKRAMQRVRLFVCCVATDATLQRDCHQSRSVYWADTNATAALTAQSLCDTSSHKPYTQPFSCLSRDGCDAPARVTQTHTCNRALCEVAQTESQFTFIDTHRRCHDLNRAAFACTVTGNGARLCGCHPLRMLTLSTPHIGRPSILRERL